MCKVVDGSLHGFRVVPEVPEYSVVACFAQQPSDVSGFMVVVYRQLAARTRGALADIAAPPLVLVYCLVFLGGEAIGFGYVVVV